MDQSIEDWVDAAAAGDRGAVENLIEHYRDDLQAFVRVRAGRMVTVRESSEDIVQSVCREVIQHADRFQHPSERAFKRWLFTTALRKLQNRREYWMAEKRAVDREVDLGSTWGTRSDAAFLAACRSFSSPSGHAMLREELQRVEDALALLKEDEREVIALAHVLGLSRSEIAKEMGRSEGAVRVLLHRALARLSAKLGQGD